MDMSQRKDINVRFPPLLFPGKQRHLPHHAIQNCKRTAKASGGDTVTSTVESSAQNRFEKLRLPERGWLYAGPGTKPRLLEQLENYVKTELQAIGTTEPQLRLQVYQNVFGRITEEFKTFRPILCAIQKEYENTLAYLQDQTCELEPLRSRLRLVTEECDRKILERWEEEHAEIRTLKREREKLQKELEAMREKEKGLQTVVAHLQSELSVQYLKYREERDARKLLIIERSAMSCSTVEDTTEKNTDGKGEDPVMLKLALRVCREDLTKALLELNKYCDVMHDWEALDHVHKQTLQQLDRLQADFDKMRSEYDILLKLHQRDSQQAEPDSSITRQVNQEELKEQATSVDTEGALQRPSVADITKPCPPSL